MELDGLPSTVIPPPDPKG